MRIKDYIFLFISGARKLHTVMSLLMLAAVMQLRSVEENKHQEMGTEASWGVKKMAHVWQSAAIVAQVVRDFTRGLSRGLYVGGFRMISNETWTKAFVQSPLLL